MKAMKLSIILFGVAYMISQYTAAARILETFFGLNYKVGIIIFSLIVATYTIVGGIRGVAYNALLQGIIMLGGSVVLAFIMVNKAGGIAAITQAQYALDPNLIIPPGPKNYLPIATAFSTFFTLGVAVMAQPHVVTRIFTVKDVPLKAYDSSGNVVDVEIVPSKIDVKVTITSPSKEIPIKIIPTGSVAFGKAISSLEASVAKVTVYGDQETLDSLNYISLDVDVTDLKANKEYKLDLTKPVGITYMSINNVTVTIALGTVSERDITGVRVVTRNLESGYSVSATSESSATVTVNLKGVASVIDEISSDDIVAYVDLTGLGVGTHEVEVSIEGTDSRVEYLSKTKKVTLTITKQ